MVRVLLVLLILFQSTPLRERRPKTEKYGYIPAKFQSTPLRERRQYYLHYSNPNLAY